MKNNVVKIDPKEFGLESENVQTIEEAFTPKIIERDGLAVIYSELITKEIDEALCKEAGDLRRKLVKVRTGIADIHKTQKAFFLSSGKFVDAWKNKETLPVSQMEEKLGEIEKFYEVQEQKKISDLKEKRQVELSKYIELFEIPSRLGTMEGDVYDSFLATKKKQHEEEIEVEKKAKSERIAKEKAEKIEQERVRKENEQLKKEAEAKAKQDKIEADERAEIESERIAKETKEREERERLAKIESDKQADILRKAQEERQRLEKELSDKVEAEKKATNDKEAAIQAELKKGDAAKIRDLKNDLKLLKTKYSFKAAKNKKLYTDVGLLLDKVINHIK